MRRWIGLALLASVAAQAGGLSPGDFFCRPLGKSIEESISNSLTAQAFSMRVEAAWASTPGLRDGILQLMKNQMSQATFSSGGAGACQLGGGNGGSGTCRQMVQCAEVPADIQKQTLQAYQAQEPKQTSFSSLDPNFLSFKEAYLAKADLDWQLSWVTCAGKSAPAQGSPMCPPADACKADVSARTQQANTDPTLIPRAIGVMPGDFGQTAGAPR